MNGPRCTGEEGARPRGEFSAILTGDTGRGLGPIRKGREGKGGGDGKRQGQN